MRRLLPILLNIVAVLSLLIGLTMAVLWRRSYSRIDEIQYYHVMVSGTAAEKLVAETQWYLAPREGGAWLYVSSRPPHGVWDGPEDGSLKLALVHGVECSGAVVLETAGIVYTPSPSRLGFVIDRIPSPIGEWRIYRVPYYAPLIAACVLPMLSVFRIVRRRRRRKLGHCRNCGYDLRATPKRCPECGDVPAAATDRPAH